jgi:hypothetical protein
MDLQVFFQKRREVERSIGTPFVLVMSLNTSDGGRAGLLTEVSGANAAHLIVEGRARLATESEANDHNEHAAKSREAAQHAAAGGVQVAVLSEQEMRSLRSSLRSQKG